MPRGVDPSKRFWPGGGGGGGMLVNIGINLVWLHGRRGNRQTVVSRNGLPA